MLPRDCCHARDLWIRSDYFNPFTAVRALQNYMRKVFSLRFQQYFRNLGSFAKVNFTVSLFVAVSDLNVQKHNKIFENSIIFQAYTHTYTLFFKIFKQT